MDEKQFITDLQKGSQSAFRHLVDTFQNKVFNTVLSIVQNAEEAEDVSQEVFIEIFESVGKFKGEAKLSTWIYRIATNKGIEYHRRKKASKRFAFLTSLFGENDEIVHHPADFEHPRILLENKERAKLLFKHINQLTDNQKVAFTLCNVEGLNYQEISEVMQLSLSSVESLLFRAKTNLRKTLKEFYVNQII